MISDKNAIIKVVITKELEAKMKSSATAEGRSLSNFVAKILNDIFNNKTIGR